MSTETLREHRKSKGLTLAGLAKDIGVTASQLSRIERGGATSLNTAVRLSQVTGLPVESFAGSASDEAA